MLREVKPKNARAARALAKRGPQLIENSKTTLFLRSTSTSSLLNSVVTDIYTLKRPLALRFSKRNTVHPFEDPSSLEFFSQKNDTSLICFSSHSKKRPHCITFVRCFNGQILDMLECCIRPETARPLSQFGGSKCPVGTKPLLSFSGPAFDDANPNSRFVIAKSLLIDFFRGEEADNVDVEGLQMMMTFTAVEGIGDGAQNQDFIYMRVWRTITQRSGQKLPRVELEEMGPRVDFRLGRVREPDGSRLKAALKKTKPMEGRSKKNVETDTVGDKVGRIHVGKQDLQDLQTRKMRGLKRDRLGGDTVAPESGRSEQGTSGSEGDELFDRRMEGVTYSGGDGARESEAHGPAGVHDLKRQRLR